MVPGPSRRERRPAGARDRRGAARSCILAAQLSSRRWLHNSGDRQAQPGYENAVSTLTQELMGLLAELKRGVPFFSGRYRAHMLSEQTIAAQVGFFATMLYNPNNVSVEASPVT